MFCPKCGEKIPEGVAFCPKCGNKVAAQAAPAPKPQPSPAHVAAPSPATAPAMGSVGSINVGAVLPLVLGVIALILAFQPWFSPSANDIQTSQYISNGANGLSSLFGGSSTAGEVYRFQQSYTMMNIGDYGKTMAAYGKSGGEVFEMLTYVWAIPVIVSVIGLVMALVQKKVAVERIGFALLAVVAAFAAYVSMTVSGPIYPGLCCLASIAVVVTAGMAKQS